MRVELSNHIAEKALQIETEIDALLTRTAWEIKTRAVPKAPYRDGYLQGSAGVESAAKNLKIVSFGMFYAEYQELGTRYTKPKDFLGSSFREAIPGCIADARRIAS
jgi:hypothetical protein